MSCCVCGDKARWYDDRTMTCYCTACAEEEARARIDAMPTRELLELLGFEEESYE